MQKSSVANTKKVMKFTVHFFINYVTLNIGEPRTLHTPNQYKQIFLSFSLLFVLFLYKIATSRSTGYEDSQVITI